MEGAFQTLISLCYLFVDDYSRTNASFVHRRFLLRGYFFSVHSSFRLRGLSTNSLTSISAAILAPCEQLQVLFVSIQILRDSFGCLLPLTNPRKLLNHFSRDFRNLIVNNLTIIQPGTFYGLSALSGMFVEAHFKTINYRFHSSSISYLSANQITAVYANTFAQMPALQILFDAAFLAIPPRICRHKCLDYSYFHL